MPAAARVIPVAPVNPPSTQVPPAASVINDINPEVQAKASADSAKAVSSSDPLQGGSGADKSIKGWTETPAKPKEKEEPPKEPISKMLI